MGGGLEEGGQRRFFFIRDRPFCTVLFVPARRSSGRGSNQQANTAVGSLVLYDGKETVTRWVEGSGVEWKKVEVG